MILLDTRCYNLECFSKNGGSPENPNFSEMEYQGKGVWKCPDCGGTMDKSDKTYSIRLKVTREDYEDGSHGCIFDIVEPHDPRVLVKPKNQITVKESFLDDITEYQEEYWDGSVGTFNCEILYYWYRCSYEYEEYDLEFHILKKTPLEAPNIEKVTID